MDKNNTKDRRLANDGRASMAQDAPVNKGILGDLEGGFAAALIALPPALGTGALVFLPLGTEHLNIGVMAGLAAAIAGGFVSALAGRPRYQISGPLTATSVILAGLVTTLAANPFFSGPDGLRIGEIAVLVSVAVFLGGVVQIVFAWLRLGRALKFIPQPVVTGFMYGIALQIFVQQIKPLLGFAGEMRLHDLPGQLDAIQNWSVIVAAVTILAAIGARRFFVRLPATMIALVAGMAAYALLRPHGAPGEVLGALPASALLSSPVPILLQLDLGAIWRDVAVDVSIAAVLIAIVGSVVTLLTAAVVDTASGSHQDGDRTLLIQGISNICASAIGGLFIGGTSLPSLAIFQSGGRSALSGATLSVIFVGLIFVGGKVFAHIPVAVLGGIMITVALSIVDDLTRDIRVRNQGSGEFDKTRAANIAIVLLVGVTTAFFNIVAAVIIGVVASTILLVVKMSTTIIYRLSDGRARSSLRARPKEQASFLRAHGDRIGIVELSGYVFFGTAVKMRTEIERYAIGRESVILDFRRVYAIEASGARELKVLEQSLAKLGVALVLSQVADEATLFLFLDDASRTKLVAPDTWFSDLDAALEWAEDALLRKGHKLAETSTEIELGRAELFGELTPDELLLLGPMLSRAELTKGEMVFREGEPGDRLFVITKGEVSIKLKLAGTSRHQRLATFGPSMMFGEMALIEGKPRSADAYVLSDTIVYALDSTALAALRADNAGIAFKLLQNLTSQLASRLRSTSEQLRATN